MKIRMHITAALVLFLYGAPSFAEKVWTTFTATNAVYDIAIQGNYVWCATANGPVRWDKRIFSYEIISDIPNNKTTCLSTDVKGDIWFGTNGGVFSMDHETGAFTRMLTGSNSSIYKVITHSSDGAVWVLKKYTGDMSIHYYIFNYKNNKWNLILNSSDAVLNLEADAIGNVWWVQNNILFCHDGTRVNRMSTDAWLPTDPISTYTVEPDGTVWLGSGKKIFRLKQGIWSTFELDQTVNYMKSVSNGVIWAVFSKGLFTFSNGIWKSYPLTPNETLGPVSKIQIDENGIIWVCTINGLIRIEDCSWRILKTSSLIPSYENFNTLAIDSAGILWIVQYNGLAGFDGRSWVTQPGPANFDLRGIDKIKIAPNGDFWLKKTSGSLVHFNGVNWEEFPTPEGMGTETIRHFEIGLDGSIWIGTNYNLWKLKNGVWEEFKSSTLADRTILSFTVGGEGYPIVGTVNNNWMTIGRAYYSIVFPDTIAHVDSIAGDSYLYPNFPKLIASQNNKIFGAYAYNKGTHHNPHPFFQVFSYNGITTKMGSGDGGLKEMDIDTDGKVWVSALQYVPLNSSPLGGGLFCIDSNNTKIFNDLNGLLNITISAQGVAPDGTVWVGHPNGLTRFGEPLNPIISSVSDAAPAPIPLLTNRPNPFNPSTTISFTLPMPGRADLTVYDITGRKVRTLMSGRMAAGAHSVVWDGRDDSGRAVSSGVYLSRLAAGKYSASGKMLLMK